MDQAVSHLWSGVTISLEGGVWDDQFRGDIASDIQAQITVIQQKTDVVFAKTLCTALNFIRKYAN